MCNCEKDNTKYQINNDHRAGFHFTKEAEGVNPEEHQLPPFITSDKTGLEVYVTAPDTSVSKQ